MDMQILSTFTPAGGAPDVIATRAPEAGDIVRIVGPNGAVEIPWTSPMSATPTPKPRAISPAAVTRLMRTVLGNVAFVALLDSTDADVRAWSFEFERAKNDMTKLQAAEGFQALVDAGAITADQRTAILAAWPAG